MTKAPTGSSCPLVLALATKTGNTPENAVWVGQGATKPTPTTNQGNRAPKTTKPGKPHLKRARPGMQWNGLQVFCRRIGVLSETLSYWSCFVASV